MEDQSTAPSNQPEQPSTNNQTTTSAPSPQGTKLDPRFTKKSKIITAVIALLLVLAGLVVYEQKLASNFQTTYKQYITSLSYTYYADDMQAFLQSDNGVLAKMYDCSATANMVWGASNSTGSADFQYTSLQNKMRGDWQTAQKAQPKYHSGILASILPQARRAHKEHTNLNDLLGASGSMLYPTSNNITTYCINRLYVPIVSLKFIFSDPTTEYSKTNNLTVVLKQTVAFEAQNIAKLKSNESPHINVPPSMTATEDLFANSFLTKLGIDMNQLLTIKTSTPQATSFGGLESSFLQDANELETAVLPQAALQGQKISPTVSDFQTLLNSVTTNN